MAALFLDSPKNTVVIAPDNAEAERFAADLAFFLGGGEVVLHLPQWEELPYEPVSRDPRTAAARNRALYRLAAGTGPLICVTSPCALLQKCPPSRAVMENRFFIIKGKETSRKQLGDFLALTGYEHADPVEEPGTFSFRGGIVDFYPPDMEVPVRVEFFGDEVESVRHFDPETQRSLKHLDAVELPPPRDVHYAGVDADAVLGRVENLLDGSGKELDLIKSRILNRQFFPGMEHYLSLFHPDAVSPALFLPSDAHVMVCGPSRMSGQIELMRREIAQGRSQMLERGANPPPPEGLWAEDEELTILMETSPGLDLCDVADEPESDHCLTVFTREVERLRGSFSRFSFDCRERGANGFGTLFTARSPEGVTRVVKLLADEEMGITPIGPPDVAEMALRLARGEDVPPSLMSTTGELAAGFVCDMLRLAVVTEEEVFGRHPPARKKAAKKAPSFFTDFADVKAGDYVVHRDHGVGLYHGLKNVAAQGETAEEYLEIEYADDQRLFLPISSIHLLEKYSGGGGPRPVLDRMGGKTWAKTRERVKKGIMRMAKELLELYAQRSIGEGHAFPPESGFEREFADSFGYTETPDQAQAIADVLEDMASPKPMDRLVCGDVGYGKTEVAMRAAFKAAVGGKQAAVLAPTTLLADQHYENFRLRMEPFGVKVGMLSRFAPPSERKKTLEALRAGEVDIVIGTHRLLQKDVVFHNLGLVVIDEEQRFGVAHKERLRKLRATVDTLTLTATPIPRTLHLSISGIRDISVINTAPPNRLAIKTFIRRFSQQTVVEAINRELSRGGQVFFVHNAVRNIDKVLGWLKKTAPGVRAEAAHGQMSGADLEAVMDRFIGHKIDLLVCTTIIESGLDIPNANTIIINRADKFGLAQMYQLRGRVGRDRHRAYAYLLVPETLSPLARKRIRAIEELNELGSGFKLAARDMEIRGAGNLLGPQQSGNITAVGFETYCRMLEEAVEELRTGAPVASAETVTVFDFTGRLEPSYIPPVEQRMNFYNRLHRAREAAEVRQVTGEMADRFGPPPERAKKLVDGVLLRLGAERLGLTRLEISGGILKLGLPKGKPLAPLLAATARRYFKGKIGAGHGNLLALEMGGAAPGDIPAKAAEFLFECAAAVEALPSPEHDKIDPALKDR